jgi:predicted mannosyl-3-phosphoglycerate phosphatase (HAD superfamily)
MTVETINAVLIAIARLEAKVDAINEKLDKLESQTDAKFLTVEKQVGQHWQKLNDHEVEISLLRERQGPKAHWTVWAVSSIGVLGFIAAFVTYVVK